MPNDSKIMNLFSRLNFSTITSNKPYRAIGVPIMFSKIKRTKKLMSVASKTGENNDGMK